MPRVHLLSRLALLFIFVAAAAVAADYPTKPIRVVVPTPPAGPTDAVARAIGDKLSARLGQAVIIENRPGAATLLGAMAVHQSAPDGYTLLYGGGQVYTPAFFKNLSFDFLRDF